MFMNHVEESLYKYVVARLHCIEYVVVEGTLCDCVTARVKVITIGVPSCTSCILLLHFF